MAPYLGVGQFLSIFYFIIFLFLFPLGGPIERLVYDAYVFLCTEDEAEQKYPNVFYDNYFYTMYYISDFFYNNIEKSNTKSIC